MCTSTLRHKSWQDFSWVPSLCNYYIWELPGEGSRRQRLSASPGMNLAVVILQSTAWKLLSPRHCWVHRQSDGIQTTPFSFPALSMPDPAAPSCSHRASWGLAKRCASSRSGCCLWRLSAGSVMFLFSHVGFGGGFWWVFSSNSLQSWKAQAGLYPHS